MPRARLLPGEEPHGPAPAHRRGLRAIEAVLPPPCGGEAQHGVVRRRAAPLPSSDAGSLDPRGHARFGSFRCSVLRRETPESNRGYIGVGREHLDGDRPVDVKESMDIGCVRFSALFRLFIDVYLSTAPACEPISPLPPPLSLTPARARNEKEKDFRNRWPTAHLPKFRPTMLELFDEADKMHLEILRAVGIGLGLEENFFDKHCNEQHENLRLLHYPPVADARKLPKGQARAGYVLGCGSVLHRSFSFVSDVGSTPSLLRRSGHTDYGTVTLLFQDQVGGLEVLSPQNQWIAAHPVPYGIVINVGDLLAQWSNDVLKSNLHRCEQRVSN